MRYIIIVLFILFGFFSSEPVRVTHTVFSYRSTHRSGYDTRMPLGFLIEVLFYLVRRLTFLVFVHRGPVFVSTRFIVRNEIDFSDKLAFNEDVGVPAARCALRRCLRRPWP